MKQKGGWVHFMGLTLMNLLVLSLLSKDITASLSKQGIGSSYERSRVVMGLR